MKATITSLIFLLLSLTVSSQTYKYIGIEEGLSNQKIYKIQKDARGYTEENSPNFRRSSDAFIETSPDEFKSAIKVVVKYCYKNKCNTENMKITFIN